MKCLIFAAVALLAGCRAGGGPQMRVIGVHDSLPHEVVFVQVTNSASHTMRLTNFTYVFAADTGKQVASGEVDLQRDVPAHAAVVVEVPLDLAAPADEGAAAPSGPLTLKGEMTAEQDQIERSFAVSARVQPTAN